MPPTPPNPAHPHPAPQIDHSFAIDLLTEIAGYAADLVRKAHARAMAPPDALPDPAARKTQDPAIEFTRLSNALTRLLAVRAALQQAQHTQTETYDAERAKAAAEAIAKRRKRATAHVKRVVNQSIETAENLGNSPSLRQSAGCLAPDRVHDLLATRTVTEVIATICGDLGILPDFGDWTADDLAAIDAGENPAPPAWTIFNPAGQPQPPSAAHPAPDTG